MERKLSYHRCKKHSHKIQKDEKFYEFGRIFKIIISGIVYNYGNSINSADPNGLWIAGLANHLYQCLVKHMN